MPTVGVGPQSGTVLIAQCLVRDRPTPVERAQNVAQRSEGGDLSRCSLDLPRVLHLARPAVEFILVEGVDVAPDLTYEVLRDESFQHDVAVPPEIVRQRGQRRLRACRPVGGGPAHRAKR
jgi:hypothetical protein